MLEPTVVDVTTHEALALVCSANPGMFARLDAVFTQKTYNIVQWRVQVRNVVVFKWCSLHITCHVVFCVSKV